MFCKKCGRELPDTAMFCVGCGAQCAKAGANARQVPKNPANQPPQPPRQAQPLPPQKPKRRRRGRIIALVTAAVLVVGAAGGVYRYWDQIVALISPPAAPTEEDVGQIYGADIDPAHVADDADGVLSYMDNEVLLVAQDGATFDQIQALAETYDAEIVGWIEKTGDFQLQLAAAQTQEQLEALAQQLEADPLVDSAYCNYVSYCGETQVQKGNQWDWGWDESNPAGRNWSMEMIHAETAWTRYDSLNPTPVRVGLIDSGFDANHEDLGFAQVFYSVSSDVRHGTHVAGTMAANGRNNEGVCGVYPDGAGRLYGVSSSGMSNDPKSGNFLFSCMKMKIGYAELILRNVKVINSSMGFNYHMASNWGGSPFPNSGEKWDKRMRFLDNTAFILGDFLNKLLDAGYDFVLVQAAGNDSDRNTGTLYDCKYSFWTSVIPDNSTYHDVYSRIIVVGAVNRNQAVTSYTNAGARLDIFAPGGDGNGGVFSTMPNDQYDDEYTMQSRIYPMCGTSMAAPHVAGAAALIWSANPGLKGDQVKSHLCNTAVRLSDTAGETAGATTGYRLLQVDRALEAAAGTAVPETATEPLNGGVMGWVVDVQTENAIGDATITASNNAGGDSYTATTDPYGHFELVLPDGDYLLTVTATDYCTETLTVTVENQQVLSLDDQIELKPDPPIVRAVLEQEETWQGEIHQYFEQNSDGITQEEDILPFMSYWFQDLDIDGELEFIAGPIMVSQRHQTVDFLVWEYAQDTLQQQPIATMEYYSAGGRQKDLMRMCVGDLQMHGTVLTGADCFRMQLCQDTATGAYRYLGVSGTYSDGQAILGWLAALDCQNPTMLETQFYFTAYFPMSDQEQFESYMIKDETVTVESFDTALADYYEGLTPYDTVVQDISYESYAAMTESEQKEALIESYLAWSYTQADQWNPDLTLSQMRDMAVESIDEAYG